MTTPPGKVIRSLRQALDMSQAEFARAAGWSASTISSWERGTTTPSRLAFKTILAFAEERGVRYRPTGDAPGLAAPVAGLPAPTSGLPTLRLGSRLPAAPLAVREGGREESFGSRRWTDVAASGVVLDVQPAIAVDERADAFDARVAALEAARSAWTLDARVRVELGAGMPWLRRATAVGAVLAALVIGAGAGTMLRGGRAPAPSTGEHASGPSVQPAARVVRVPLQADALAAVAVPPLAAAPYAAGTVPDAPAERAAAMPPPEHARLESIVALDGTRRATFRVGDRSIALVEGDELGGRTVALIGNDEVALVGGGVATRVRLGFDTPIH